MPKMTASRQRARLASDLGRADQAGTDTPMTAGRLEKIGGRCEAAPGQYPEGFDLDEITTCLLGSDIPDLLSEVKRLTAEPKTLRDVIRHLRVERSEMATVIKRLTDENAALRDTISIITDHNHPLRSALEMDPDVLRTIADALKALLLSDQKDPQ